MLKIRVGDIEGEGEREGKEGNLVKADRLYSVIICFIKRVAD